MTAMIDAQIATLETDEYGLERLQVRTGGGEATIYRLGAHLTHWQPAGQEPVLWMSAKSMHEVGKPLRGGVPICFPWFGAKADDPDAPGHGFVRLAPWEVVSATRLPDGRAEIRFAGPTDPPHRHHWPHAYGLEFVVRVGDTLEMGLIAENRDAQPIEITEALHTYFAISDVHNISVTGLAGASYISKVEGGQYVQDSRPIRFGAETDRVYINTGSTVTLHDPGMNRRIVVSKTGSKSTVVWNPWIDKAARMPDYGDAEWPGMLCIETANAVTDAVTLPPGGSHAMWAKLSVERM